MNHNVAAAQRSRYVERLRRSIVTDAVTSARMRRVPRVDTSIERQVRSAANRLGARYRIQNKELPGSPDLANRSKRWAVFVHGCFWHAHDRCARATIPSRNRSYWLAKFANNRERDRNALTELSKRGFRCLVIWECQVRRRPGQVLRTLERFLRRE